LIIDSIEALNIHPFDYEIIINGPPQYNSIADRSDHISVSNDWKPQWITRQKNDIARRARYDNIVLLHDYIVFDQDWYTEFEKFGDDWDVCMNCIINNDGTRFRDWVLWEPQWVDYNDHSQTRNMYVSGSYFCVKKDFFLRNPLDERLYWGQEEDVIWSKQVRPFWNYKCNSQSKVRLLKYKHTHTPGVAQRIES